MLELSIIEKPCKNAHTLEPMEYNCVIEHPNSLYIPQLNDFDYASSTIVFEDIQKQRLLNRNNILLIN